MSSKVVAVKFFDPEHGPGKDIVLHLSEEDAEKVVMLDKLQTPVELPSLPGQFHLSNDATGNFAKWKGTGGKTFSGSLSEIISSIEDPENTYDDE
ncbi:hypothetical protein [Vreelandella populi]|uniref:Uncharacterized protein n=1 Tax=Vreelandella populi TaxID=2498858 RepID=A0A3S0YYS5_9GAMM|nr:hypothetical protein [Halomonas populi]RUR46188.1 hypothetical protein ELY37_09370 [Halomonas populi]